MKHINKILRNYSRIGSGSHIRGIKNAVQQNYTKTVLLPQTDFPARYKGKKRVEMDSYLIEVGSLFLYINFSKQEFVFQKSV